MIFGAVTIFAIISWYFTPEDKWLRREMLVQAMKSSDVPEDETSATHEHGGDGPELNAARD